MKKLYTIILAVLCMQGYAQFSGGTGTPGDPYVIANKTDLDTLSSNPSYWDDHFIQTADIMLTAADFQSGGIFYNAGEGFSPIGNGSTNFTGSYNGKGHVIDGLYINRPSLDFIGFFGAIGSGATVDSIGLTNVNITGNQFVGGLCGHNNGGSISNCFTTGIVSGNYYVGGFCGFNDNNGSISYCYSMANVPGTATGVGGFCGVNYGSSIFYCYSTGNVSGSQYVGGLCSYNYTGTISYCYSTGNVSGLQYVSGLCSYNYTGTISYCYSTGSVSGIQSIGGLCGINYGGAISNCYSTGSVSGTDYVGGFCSYAYYGYIINCYSVGSVTGNNYVGGFCGYNYSYIVNCFWDIQTSGQATSSGGTGLPTAQMQTQSTYTIAGWDFINTWTMSSCINNGYPYLTWSNLNTLPNQNTYSTISPSACDSYTSPSGKYIWTTGGTYMDTIPNVAGCDSVITINLTIYNPQYDTLTVSSCDSYTWSQNGMSYTSSGMYYDTIANAVGGVCDSIYVLDLTIYNPQYDTLTVSSCDSYTWLQNGMMYTTSGIYYDTIANAVGGLCDSIYVLDLTIYNPQYDTLTVSSCDSYTWMQNGMMYTTTGIYYDTIANAVGGVCDSIYVLDLTIYYSQYDTLTVSSCDSYTWLQNGMMYTASGIYYDTIYNAVGGLCDSIYVLNLTIYNPQYDTLTVSSCDSYTWLQNGMMYTASGIYYDTIYNAVGGLCDSIYVLNLTIYNPQYDTLTVSSCDSYTWMQNGMMYTTSGVYYDTIENVVGGVCDSIYVLNLTIKTVDATVTDSLTTLTAVQAGASYQWVLCPGFAPIAGATNQSFTAMINGYYAVIVTLNGCTDTSICVPVSSVGIKDNIGETGIKLYPNPTIDGHITLQTDRLCEQMQVVIRDVTGKQISVYEFKNTRQADITIEEESKGLYFIEIITKEGIRKNYKVIKQ